MRAEDLYIEENPLRSYMRQPTSLDNTAGHGSAQRRQGPTSESESVSSHLGAFGQLTLHSPGIMNTGETSPIIGDERSIQPEESMLPSSATTEQVLRDLLRIPHGYALNLSSLREITNPAKLPNLTHLAALAIWASPHKRLTLSEIYDAIEARYPILKDCTEKPWKESLRHRLSLKAVFVRVGGQTEKGRRGGYWALDVSKGLSETKRSNRQGSGGTPNLSPSDHDDTGSSDYSDHSHASSSISLYPTGQAPVLNYGQLLFQDPPQEPQESPDPSLFEDYL